MTEDDPTPLKAGGDAAPELVRALYALEAVRPDAAAHARIEARLSVALASALRQSTVVPSLARRG